MTIQQQIAPDLIGLIRRALLSRRRFMTASAAAAAGYTLAAGPVRAEAIKTDSDGLDTGTAKIETAENGFVAVLRLMAHTETGAPALVGEARLMPR